MTAESASLVPAYTKMVNRIIYNTAKTMPIDERRATAHMALCEALRDYTPTHCALDRFIAGRVKDELVRQNRQYTGISAYNSKSFDAPVKDDSKVTLRDMTAPSSMQELMSIEEEMDFSFFMQNIADKKVSRLIIMLRDGYTTDEICVELKIKPVRFAGLCDRARELWHRYSLDNAM